MREFYYGGQAVIRGVMIRGRQYMVVALRRLNGDISVFKEPIPSFFSRWRRFPLIRGFVVLIETAYLGIKALMLSADVLARDEGEEVGKGFWYLSLLVGIFLGIALFIILPLFLAGFLERMFELTPLWGNLLDGLLRILIFLLYLGAITLIPSIKEVLAYHGAEHKVVNAYEHGEELSRDKVKPFSVFHMRCGTGFILLVFIIALIVFPFLGKGSLPVRLAERIVIFPLIAVLSYEIIRFSAKNRFLSLLLKPLSVLQFFMTREPDDEKIEVAIKALREAISLDKPS